MTLSTKARTLWAKAPRGGDEWLPLRVHMADAAGMAQKLWDNWLPRGTKTLIANGMGRNVALKSAGWLTTFLAAAHDVGKATPAFQSQNETLKNGVADLGLCFKPLYNSRAVHHSLASQAILRRLCFDISIAVVVGGHHGTPPGFGDVEMVEGHTGNTGFDNPGWLAVQEELVNYALELSGVGIVSLRSVTLSISAQVVLSGLVIMADWLASNEDLFPYISVSRFDASNDRVECAWEKLRLTPQWDVSCEGLMSSAIFQKRFGGRCETLRPLQRCVVENFPNIERPGIVVIEAPMGEGKTEAALAAAEIFAGNTGRGGVFFALPTQATSDGLFPRLVDWMKNFDRGGTHDLQLAHGKSRFNEEYKGLPAGKVNVGGYDDTDEGVVVHEWFNGRKKGMLAGFVVGTVDQLLLAGLRQKHLALRHLGLANKVVVIDECHAYDAYMSQYLFKALRWLGAYGVPVIVLSATLPGEKRREIIQEYLGDRPKPKEPLNWAGHSGESVAEPEWAVSRSYPIITYADGGEIRQIPVQPFGCGLRVALEPLAEEALVDRLDALLVGGGCAGIIVNTVKRAQMLWRTLAERMGRETVRLLHSRFLARDRAEKEKDLREMLGPPGRARRPEKLVVIGTQVMEQSLDVDFDVLFSDLCPMDLLIQRIGRLHRHERGRPVALKDPRCFVLGLEDGEVFDGSEKVYGKWPLLSAREILREHEMVKLPDDIAGWVNRAYMRDGVSAPAGQKDRFEEALREYHARIRDQRDKAEVFQIADPYNNLGDLTGWLSIRVQDGASGKRGEAMVRDTDPSLEVIVVEAQEEGKFNLLPWVETGATLPAHGLADELASVVAGCTVTLPRRLSAPWKVADTIDELERDNLDRLPLAWQESPWLRGELFLVLNREGEELAAYLGGYRLVYDRECGLIAMREGNGA